MFKLILVISILTGCSNDNFYCSPDFNNSINNSANPYNIQLECTQLVKEQE